MAAGGINAVAGGGTLVSFPALIWAGLPHREANITSTVALLPGSLGGAAGFLPELKSSSRWLRLLALPSLVGGLLGGWLLLRTPPTFFKSLVPFLILGATLLMAVQDPLRARLEARRINSVPGVMFFQFLVGIYGGYFGAGIGILMLAALTLLGISDIHQANGLKNFLAFLANGSSAVYFVVMGNVHWQLAGILAVGALLGGYVGARLARRLDRRTARRMVVVFGLLMSLAMFVR